MTTNIEPKTPICYLGVKECGCIVEFVSAYKHSDIAKEVAAMIKRGLTAKVASFEDDDTVGQLCDLHFAELKGRIKDSVQLEILTALTCLEEMKRNHTYHGQKIGKVKQAIDSIVSYRKGEFVIIERDYGDGKCCIGKPLSIERIRENMLTGSLITTMGTTVNVPLDYIEVYSFSLKHKPAVSGS